MAHGCGWLGEAHPLAEAPPHPMTWGPGDPRTSTAEWRRLRLQILDRDQHRCQWRTDTGICGAPANEVDHIVEVADGGDDHPSNLRALCEPHHKRKTAAHANRTRWSRRRRPTGPHPGYA